MNKMRNKSKRVLAIMMAMMVASGSAATTAATVFATPALAAETVSIANATVTLAIPEGGYTYTGAAQEPAVTVTLNGETLATSSYAVSYSNSTDAGTATVTVTGKGACVGTVSKTYTIAKRDLSEAAVVLNTTGATSDSGYLDGYGYECNPVYGTQPTVSSVTVSAVTKDSGVVSADDYTVSYSNNKAVSAKNYATVTITAKADSNFTGSVTKNFEVIATAIETGDIATIADQAKTGSQIKPALTITKTFTNPADKEDTTEVTLKEGTDYEVAYSNNINAGTATATVTAATGSNYSFTNITKSFTIKDYSIDQLYTAKIVDAAGTVYKAGTENTPSVAIYDNYGEKLESNDGFTISYPDNTKAGTQYVKITNDSYAGEIKVAYTVEAVKLDEAGVRALLNVKDDKKTLNLAEGAVTYNHGEAVKLAAADIFTDATGLEEGKDYTVTYKNNVNAGTATATVTLIGDYAGSPAVDVNFTISPYSLTTNSDNVKVQASTTNGKLTKVYTGKAVELADSDIVVNIVNAKDEVVATVPTSAYTLSADSSAAGARTITVEAVENGNYAASTTASGILTISKADWNNAVVTVDNLPDQSTQFTTDTIADYVHVTLNGEELKAADYTIGSVTYDAKKGGVVVSVTGAATNFTNNTTAKTATAAVVLNIQDYLTVTPNNNKVTGKYFADDVSNVVYDGTAKTPKLNVTAVQQADGTTPTLTEGVDYKFVYTNSNNKDEDGNVLVGDVTVTVVGIGSYAGKLTDATNYKFTIAAKSIKDSTVTVEAPEIVGTTITTADALKTAYGSKVVVKDGDKVLEYDVDYTVAFSALSDGKTTLTVKGKGNYDSNTNTTVEITAKTDFTTFDVVTPDTAPVATVVDGKATLTADQLAQFKIEKTDAGKTTRLTLGTDYTAEVTAFDAAKKTATVTFTGIGSYSGTLTTTVSVDVSVGKVTGLKAVKKTTTTLKLQFNAVGDEGDVDGYEIYDAEANELLTTVSTQNGAEVLKKTVTGLTAGETRSYKVRAYKEVNGEKVYGAFSKTYTKATAAVDQVTGLKAIKKTKTTLKLQFNAVDDADGYKIYDAETGKLLANVSTQGGASVLKKTITGLKAGQTRKYKVRAYKKLADGTKTYGAYSTVYTKATAK
jgi:hypothetical protein